MSKITWTKLRALGPLQTVGAGVLAALGGYAFIFVLAVFLGGAGVPTDVAMTILTILAFSASGMFWFGLIWALVKVARR